VDKKADRRKEKLLTTATPTPSAFSAEG